MLNNSRFERLRCGEAGSGFTLLVYRMISDAIRFGHGRCFVLYLTSINELVDLVQIYRHCRFLVPLIVAL